MSLIEESRRIRLTSTTMTVDYIVSLWNPDTTTGVLFLPDTQRLWVSKWDHQSKKEKLIDSVMHNYPIPTIIMNEIDGRRYELHDGRHRVHVLYLYRTNQFKWRGSYYKDLVPEDRRGFDERSLIVLIMRNATADQLADAFIRVNEGAPLRDYDFCWTYRVSHPIVRAARDIVCSSKRLQDALGGIDLHRRSHLANWCGLTLGMATRNAGNISSSWIKISPFNTANGFVVNNADLLLCLNALCDMYERANDRFPCNQKTMRSYSKNGYINAFFLADWMAATSDGDRNDMIEKWVDIVGKTRGAEKNAMKAVLKTTGAQNLNHEKIVRVLTQVNNYLETNAYDHDYITDDDDDEHDSV